jgi:hypothetical protein
MAEGIDQLQMRDNAVCDHKLRDCLARIHGG